MERIKDLEDEVQKYKRHNQDLLLDNRILKDKIANLESNHLHGGND